MEAQSILEKFLGEIIIAAIAIIVTVITSWIKKHPPKIWVSATAWSKIAVVVMIISLLFLIVAVGIVFCEIFTPKEPTVEISHPSDGATVELREMIRGTSQNIPQDYEIWIVIYPQVVGCYFPQNDSADIQANGDWSSLVFIGLEGDIGLKFDIIVVLANKEAQDLFNDYLTQSESEESWPGISKLPDSAVVYDRVTVTRE
jgi:hypothetical protein